MSEKNIRIFTVGFTHKSAEAFFTLLKQAKVKRLIDVRLQNVSQLAGFSKRDDLAFFTRALCRADYLHRHDLAPSPELFRDYRKLGGDWEPFARRFRALLAKRRIEDKVSPGLLDRSCLLCSEASPHHCHRRLVAEYLARRWTNVRIEHLE